MSHARSPLSASKYGAITPTHDNGEPGSNLAAYPINIPVKGYILGALTLLFGSLMLGA